MERVVPLGQEATDLQMVEQVARRNGALERSHHGRGLMGAIRTDVEPMPDDETYAVRYHSAFASKDRT